ARQHGRPFRRTLARVLSTGRPSLLMRFLQAGYVAERAARLGVQHFHAHFATRATTAALLASSISGIPYSFTAHAFDIYRSSVRPQVLSDKIRNASFVVTISEANREYLKGVANGSAANVALVRNGIDLQRFRPNGATADPPFTVLSVARLVEKKGLPVLVAACRILRDRGVSFRCQIIGRGRQRPQLLDLIDRWDLRRTVRLLGGRRQGEVLEFYRSAHAYVLPSIVGGDGNKEGLPVSIVEALACGLPVVSTPIAGIPEVVTHGTNGLLVPPGDAAALADALQRIITDRATYDRLRNNARRTVEKSFDTGQTSKDLHELFLGASA
ncbi:MAG: glycosyltransferase, partial [Acidobacteriota bacterium]|nr:glycosyltransferase [Acidobacteriota bacterium]